MHTISNNTTSCFFGILVPDGYLDQFHSADVQEELNLIGTERTVVNVYGFGSPAAEYSIVLTEEDFQKFELIRKAQSTSNPVRFDGDGFGYALTITTPPRKMLNEFFYAIWMGIRLKRI